MPVVTREASLKLNFLVVGGGVGGLAVAYVLANAGHRVRVIEKSNLNAYSGGHRIPPNFSKILKQWVGQEELMKVSTRCLGSPMLRLRTGERVGYLHWKPAVMEETGGEFLMMHHDDLIRMLHRLATEAGARVDFDTPVASVQQGSSSSPNPRVTLASGEVLTADIVIGADGSRSLVREVVLGEKDDPSPGGVTVYTATVNAEEMKRDPELRPLVEADEFPIWMGEHRAFCGHPVRNRKEWYFGIYSWNNLDGLPQEGEESWHELIPTDRINIEHHGPAVQRIIKMAPHLIRTRYMVREDGIEDWVDETGRIVLLGDAAHPPYPGGSHSGSMATEDAVVFGVLMSHLHSLEQLPSLLSAYQELRQRRCELVNQGDVKNGQLVVMPPGPAADMRDAVFAHHVEEWDEGTMRALFEEIAEIFVYDAGDAAEEWWINWGRFHRARPEQEPLYLNGSRTDSSYTSE